MLIDAGRDALKVNPMFRSFLKSLGAPPPPRRRLRLPAMARRKRKRSEPAFYFSDLPTTLSTNALSGGRSRSAILPKQICIDAMIGMAQAVAEIGHAQPVNLRPLCFYLGGNPARGFADDLKRALDCQSQQNVRGEICRCFVRQRRLNGVDGSKYVRQSIGQCRRHD